MLTLSRIKHSQKKIFIFHSILYVGSCILTGIRRKTSGSQLGNWILWSLFNFLARWTDYIYTHQLTMPRDLEAEANQSRTVQAHVYTKGLSLQNRLACPSHPAGIIPGLFSQPKLCFANFWGKTKAGKGQTHSDMGDCMLVPGTFPSMQEFSLIDEAVADKCPAAVLYAEAT